MAARTHRGPLHSRLDARSSHLERMDVRVISSFGLGALLRRQASSVDEVVPIPQEVGFAAHEVVSSDLADVLYQNEAVAGDDQFVDCRVRVRLVGDVPTIAAILLLMPSNRSGCNFSFHVGISLLPSLSGRTRPPLLRKAYRQTTSPKPPPRGR